MSQDYNAIVNLEINAPAQAVWEALTKPKLIKHYMHDTDVITDWQEGNTIMWRGVWEGKPYEDKGVVLKFDQPTLLSYTHWSPLGGSEDKSENYHTITIELAEENGLTKLTLTQSNNPTQEAADAMAKNGWQPMMDAMKTLVEKP